MKLQAAQERAERILHFYRNAGDNSTAKTCAHFEKEGVHPSTTRQILKRCIERGTAELKPRGGHNATPPNDGFLHKVEHVFRTNPSVSVRTAAKQLGVPKSTVSDAKVRKLGIRAFTKKDAPKYTNGQEERAQAACGILARKTWSRVLIMDDETYVQADPSQVRGRSFYHAKKKNEVGVEHRLKPRKCCGRRPIVHQSL
jgi:hypothetical protein